ncbi:MAG: tRNA (guanosine(46)-N7)-methyltransferase TrmB [Alphaproteobacteria bacterium]|nr:tRNA (guanosine(46)-N7)-methyltransferase TrmB [Alphaproteobacteria bacterium]
MSLGADRDGRHDPPRTLYGRRKGRPLRAGRQALVDGLLPRLRLDVDAHVDADAGADAGAAIVPARLFERPIGALWVEIGFGAGEHLVHQAAAHPDIGFIGCEPFINGVARALASIEAAGLDNVRIVVDDARLLLARLPEASVGRIFVLYPDPWRKARHHKRRILGPATTALFARVLADAAELRVATDHPGYLGWILEHVRAAPEFDWLARRPSDWRTRPPDWPPTRYGEKAARAGRRSAFLRFTRRPRAGPDGDKILAA